MSLDITRAGPRAAHLGRRIRERSDHAQATDGLCKRQNAALVLQHHDGACADRARQRAPLGHARGGLRRAAAIGIFEKAKPLFEGEYAAHGCINLRQAHEPAFHGTGQAVPISIGHHIDVHPGVERQRSRLRQVCGDAVVD